MTRILASFVILAVVSGLIESGLDIAESASSDDHAGAAHEIHGHLGTDGSPSGDDGDVVHFCHCVTHSAALAFSIDLAVVASVSKANLFRPAEYRSLAIPPPVPPPNV